MSNHKQKPEDPYRERRRLQTFLQKRKMRQKTTYILLAQANSAGFFADAMDMPISDCHLQQFYFLSKNNLHCRKNVLYFKKRKG